MPETLAAPRSIEEIDQADQDDLAQLGGYIHQLRARESAVSEKASDLEPVLHPIREWVLQATRDARFADQLLLGQIAILWLEVEDAVSRQQQDDFEMAVTMIEEAIRRADRRDTRRAIDESPAKAIDFVLSTLPGLSSGELGELFDVSERTVRSWRQDLPENPQTNQERLSTLAQVLCDVRPSTTDRGAYRWFQRRLYQLNNRRPIDLLNSGASENFEALRTLARSSRGQGA